MAGLASFTFTCQARQRHELGLGVSVCLVILCALIVTITSSRSYAASELGHYDLYAAIQCSQAILREYILFYRLGTDWHCGFQSL